MSGYIVSKLVMEINSSQKLLNEAKAFLTDVNVECRGRAFTNEESVLWASQKVVLGRYYTRCGLEDCGVYDR